ncbi:MAG: hypothetical protein HUU56_09810 [Bdellovibrionaceae bacterium]|nr:hypothetical protein [Pseudobdellovibrionaceae bacterium]
MAKKASVKSKKVKTETTKKVSVKNVKVKVDKVVKTKSTAKAIASKKVDTASVAFPKKSIAAKDVAFRGEKKKISQKDPKNLNSNLKVSPKTVASSNEEVLDKKQASVKGAAKNDVVKKSKIQESMDSIEVVQVVSEKASIKKVSESKKSKAAAKLEIEQNAKWSDLFEKFKAVKPITYNMREVFEANQPIQHKVLGWGWILSNENDRLEVLFKEGKKILISNYKG